MLGMAGSDFGGIAHAHIVFCTQAAGTAHLDCVSESAETSGWPFTLVVDIPEGAEWSKMASRLLSRWTNEARGLALRLEANRNRARVRMSDGECAVRLDLVEIRLDPVV